MLLPSFSWNPPWPALFCFSSPCALLQLAFSHTDQIPTETPVTDLKHTNLKPHKLQARWDKNSIFFLLSYFLSSHHRTNIDRVERRVKDVLYLNMQIIPIYWTRSVQHTNTQSETSKQFLTYSFYVNIFQGHVLKKADASCIL